MEAPGVNLVSVKHIFLLNNYLTAYSLCLLKFSDSIFILYTADMEMSIIVRKSIFSHVETRKYLKSIYIKSIFSAIIV